MNRRERPCGAGRGSFSSRECCGGHHLPRYKFILLLLALLLPEANPATFETAYRAGLDALGKNNLPVAQVQFEAAAKLQPRNAQVWLALSQTYFKLNQSKLAAEAAVRAETLAGSEPVVLHGLAFYYTEARDPARAAALEARYAEKSPEDREAYGRAIDLYLRASRPKPAILLAQKALVRQDTPELHEMLAKALDADGQFEKSIAQYRHAAQLRPYDETYASALGRALLRRQRFGEALDVLQAARQRFDRSAQIQLGLGEALFGLRRFPESIDALLLTIQLDSGIEQPYLLLGRLIDHAEGKMPEVTAALATYVSVKPEQVEPLLRKSILLNSSFWESHFALGTVLEKRQDRTGAAAEFQKSNNLKPNLTVGRNIK